MKYKYKCANCGAPAKKQDFEHERAPLKLGLGKWYCTKQCSSKIKVKRSL